MNIETLSESRLVAKEKWHEYKNAEKATGDPLYRDLRKVYNQIKGGKKIIDIFKVIQKGGVHENFHPKLAIAKATNKTVVCHYSQEGDAKYLNNELRRPWNDKEFSSDVILKKCLPKIPKEFLPKVTWGISGHADEFKLQAPVPLIPPKHRPKVLTDDYYILWEVDEWKMVPPTDPWLLKRITKTLFVVLAGWDLTELEKAVMKGRII